MVLTGVESGVDFNSLHFSEKDGELKDSTFTLESSIMLYEIAKLLKEKLMLGNHENNFGFYESGTNELVYYMINRFSKKPDDFQFKIKEVSEGKYEIALISERAKKCINRNELKKRISSLESSVINSP